MLALIAFVGLLLAYANGANDNFKGVATLLGSGTAGYRRALVWATITTALGSVTALVLARELLQSFTGKGLVPAATAGDASFPAAVALAAGLTVLLATRFGFPVSTTHALIGAMIGAGLLASPDGVNGSKLASGFMLPLLTSPFIAVLGALLIYPPLRSLRRRMAVSQETTVFGLQVRPLLDTLHYLSAGAVSFARGVNDTPKLAALLVVGEMATPGVALIAVGAMIAVGGLTAARRVAITMSQRVTGMNPGQGFVANFVTAGLVIGASTLALPVSTTHVSCGSLFGIGAVTGRAHWKTIGTISLAWIITLPLAGVLAAVFSLVLRGLR